jgi:hypothetical protein
MEVTDLEPFNPLETYFTNLLPLAIRIVGAGGAITGFSSASVLLGSISSKLTFVLAYR